MTPDVITARDAGDLAAAQMTWTRDAAGKWVSPMRTADGQNCTTCGERIPFDETWRDDYGQCACSGIAHRMAVAAWYEHRGLDPREWGRSDTPARFKESRFATFTDREGTETAVAHCSTWAESYDPATTSSGLYLSGPWGTGKTHLAVATLFRACQRTVCKARFITAGGLIAKVKGGSDFNMEPHRQATEAQLLVLDDIGQIGRTEFDRELIYTLIAARYEKMRPTIYTSNLPLDRLKESLGGAAVSRLYETTTQLVLNASDYRRAGEDKKTRATSS